MSLAPSTSTPAPFPNSSSSSLTSPTSRLILRPISEAPVPTSPTSPTGTASLPTFIPVKQVNNTSKAGPIAGGTIGGVAVLLIVGLFLYEALYKKRWRVGGRSQNATFGSSTGSGGANPYSSMYGPSEGTTMVGSQGGNVEEEEMKRLSGVNQYPHPQELSKDLRGLV